MLELMGELYGPDSEGQWVHYALLLLSSLAKCVEHRLLVSLRACDGPSRVA